MRISGVREDMDIVLATIRQLNEQTRDNAIKEDTARALAYAKSRGYMGRYGIGAGDEYDPATNPFGVVTDPKDETTVWQDINSTIAMLGGSAAAILAAISGKTSTPIDKNAELQIKFIEKPFDWNIVLIPTGLILAGVLAYSIYSRNR